MTKVASGAYTRKYSWPPMPPHEFTVTSVTSCISGGLPKPFLVGWAAKMTAESAIADHEIIGLMLKKGDKRGAIDHVKGSRYRDMNNKADRGTIVHAAVDAYLSGKPFTPSELNRRLDESHIPESMKPSTTAMISGIMEFLWDTEPEIIWNEATMYSRTHGYGGTADIIARLQVGGTMNYAVIDMKTSKAIYDEVALQLSAYANADFVGLNDGTEAPLIPVPPKPKASASAKVKAEYAAALKVSKETIKYGIVVRPKADGSYERADFTLTPDVFDMFLHCKGVTEAMDTRVLAQSRRPTVQ